MGNLQDPWARPSLDAVKTAGSEYIPTLDGWRAIAILWVMLFHDNYAIFGETGVLPCMALQNLAQAGGSGVSIFFGLSGFLICMKLVKSVSNLTQIDITRFYISRCFRILPPYLLYLFVVGALTATQILNIDPRAYLSCFVFLRNYLPDTLIGEWYTGHFWSLSVEEHFYLFWPWILVASATSKRGLRVAIMMAILVGSWRAVELPLRLLSRAGLPVNETERRTDVCLDGLLFGCYFAMLLTFSNWKSRLSRWLSFPIWALLFATFIFVACLRMPKSPISLLSSFLAPLLLVGTILRPQEIVGRFLEWRPLAWVGRLSYSLYIWQQLFLRSSYSDKPLGRLQTFPTNWLATFCVAMASYYLIERPMIRMGRRVTRGIQCRRSSRARPSSNDAG
jgi:peptidoglycan/LPS O-acetylase OafA/YrhL